MARAADTNVIVRLIMRDDPTQLALALVAASAGLWVSLVVLVETAWVLEKGYGRSRADCAATIEMLLDHSSLMVEAPELVRTAAVLARANRGIDFADAVIVELARRTGVGPLMTFDRALGKVDGAELIIKAPAVRDKRGAKSNLRR
jgi:predicted nucleic-acid-binding protein